MTDLRRKIAALALSVCTACVTIGCGAPASTDTDNNKTPPPAPEYTIESTVPIEDANNEKYAVKNVVQKQNSPLAGKTIYWLGSSVTHGAASQQESMADFLAALTGCTSKKEAVSGTTLFDDGGNGDSGAKSYTRRLVNSTVFDKDEHVDAFVCQISTNDSIKSRLKYRGKFDAETVDLDPSSYDRKTTLGGVEFIIAYVIETWDCPVYFYSGSYIGGDGARKNNDPSGANYGKLVDEVKLIAAKWAYDGYDVKVIDLFNDAEFNAKVTDEYYKWCMSDPVHPKRAGYLQWWTPYIETQLIIDLAAK